jgi:hypothetical protein
MSERIQTSYWAKPIPDRRCDWTAWYDNDEPDDDGKMLCGFGATEAEAIADLYASDPDRAPEGAA